MPIHAVIFDRDNTLMCFDEAVGASLEARMVAAAPGLPIGAASRHWESWPGPWPRTSDDEPLFWRAFWETIAQAHGLPSSSAAALETFGGFYHTCFAAYPDTAACLTALRACGLRLAVLTNFELPSVHLTLRHAGIEPAWFDALLSSAAIGARKPDPRAYLATADALGLPPSECAFVDDLIENVQAARSLGMYAVLIDREHTLPEFSPIIHTLDELLPLVLAHSSHVPSAG
jgi:putative hydrolase of the HAD superfamily